MLVKLSANVFVHYSRINTGKIILSEDQNAHYIIWFTDDGEFSSDAFTGRIAAANFIQSVDDEIERLTKKYSDVEDPDEED